MKKILISVAPVCHEGAEIPAGIKVPYTPEEIASEEVACAQAGAGMVHLHVRNDNGKQTADLSWFRQTIDKIREQSDIIIQGSTGGVADLSLEERCVSLNDTRVEVASLNMGSTNLGNGVYINTLPDIRYWAARMKDVNVLPEMEIFDLSMIASVARLHAEGLAGTPFMFNFCLGFENALEATADNLFILKNAIPAGSHWGIIHENMEDFRLLVAAACIGATSLRIGFEDSFYYQKGKVAQSPSELVSRLVATLKTLDFEPMSAKEARQTIGIPVSNPAIEAC